jgi:uncharacterized membrane protein
MVKMASRTNAHDRRTRTLAKAVAYRLLSITADTIVAYFFTRNSLTTFAIVAFVNGYSTLLYYAHERIWAHIHWGRGK